MSSNHNTKPGKRLSWLEKPLVFYGFLIAHIIILFATKFFPSGDGPSHLHNARLMLNMILGDNILHQYFEFNNSLIANWPGHTLLAFFMLFLPAWLAEKALLIIYVAGIALSFRFLVKIINPDNIIMSLLIFPFIHSFLLYNGFYNFALSIIFLFLIPAVFLKKYLKSRTIPVGWMIALFFFSALTNILAFFTTGLITGTWILFISWQNYKNGCGIRVTLKSLATQLTILLLTALPAIVVVTAFLFRATFYSESEATVISGTERIKWLIDARPFIVFRYVAEEIVTQTYSCILVFILAVSLPVFFRQNNTDKRNIALTNAILLPIVVVLILFLITPVNSGAGMMGQRYALLLFYLVIIWIAATAKSSIPVRIALLLILVLHLVNFATNHIKFRTQLDRQAKSINYCVKHIEPHSVVLPVNLSEHWMMGHFPNYLGVDKPMIILENYEACMEWFPLKWKHGEIPVFLLGDKTRLQSLSWIQGWNEEVTQPIDIVFIFGDIDKLRNEEWDDLQKILQSSYKLAYESRSGKERVYKRKIFKNRLNHTITEL